MAINLNENSFSELIGGSTKLCLVVLLKEWSGASEVIRQLLPKIASLYSEKVVIIEVTPGNNYELFNLYPVKNYPSILIFKQGEVIDVIEGVYPLSFYEGKLKELLNK